MLTTRPLRGSCLICAKRTSRLTDGRQRRRWRQLISAAVAAVHARVETIAATDNSRRFDACISLPADDRSTCCIRWNLTVNMFLRILYCFGSLSSRFRFVLNAKILIVFCLWAYLYVPYEFCVTDWRLLSASLSFICSSNVLFCRFLNFSFYV